MIPVGHITAIQAFTMTADFIAAPTLLLMAEGSPVAMAEDPAAEEEMVAVVVSSERPQPNHELQRTGSAVLLGRLI